MADTFEHGYAVIVGSGGDLPVTAQDATGVASLLRDPARCAYDPARVQLLAGEAAGRGPVLAALDALATQARLDPESTAIVYFSGHGIALPEPYLLPYGYDLQDLPGTAIPGALFTEKLRQIPARKLLVLLDCCHAARQAEAGIKAPPLPQAPAPPQVFEELKRSSGRVVIASSRKDEYSYTGSPYSIFTATLLEGLAGYGSFEQDGFARVLDVALYTNRMVANRTQDRQHPILKVSGLEDNFALAYYAAGQPQPKGLDWSSATTAPARFDSSEQAAWQRMLANKRENLLLMEERMSEYVEYQEVPLQLIKNKRLTESQIAELEGKLGLRVE